MYTQDFEYVFIRNPNQARDGFKMDVRLGR